MMIHPGDNPVGGPAARKAMRWRWPLAAVVLVVVAFAGLTAWLFVWPATATPERADAVVVFAGGRGERLRAATRLIGNGVAPTLVISNGWDPVWTDANRLCRGWSEATVLCPTPDPDTTGGEARMVAALAERSGWRSVVLVTSTYHVRRASWLLGRCYQGSVQTVAARPQPTLSLTAAIAHEWLALPATLAGGNAAEHAKRRRVQRASEELVGRVTDTVEVPTIGIGAGPHCDAQVLVWQDMAGLTSGPAAPLRQALRRP